MMGLKAREVTARHTVSLEDLVPADDFYRHLDRVLDLAFVRDLVRDTYAPAGRPSIDPVVFFRLQLVLFFEGLRSERQLLRVVADRLSLRWYLGYDLGERLPDHSSLTRIRDRYGLEVFRRFFEAIVERCQAAGLVWGKELYIDGTKVEANAALHSLRPRFYVEAHLRRLFGDADAAPAADGRRGGPGPAAVAPPPVLPTAAPDGAGRGERRAPRLARRGRAAGPAAHRGPRAAALRAAGRPGGEHDRPGRDADGPRGRGAPGLQDPLRRRRRARPASSSPPWSPRRRCGTTSRRRTCSGTPASGGACAPGRSPGTSTTPPSSSSPPWRTPASGPTCPCPTGTAAPASTAPPASSTTPSATSTAARRGTPCAATTSPTASRPGSTAPTRPSAPPAPCGRPAPTAAWGAPCRAPSGPSTSTGCGPTRSTPAYQKALRKRSVWVEPLFGEAKDWHGLRRFRLRRLPKVNTAGPARPPPGRTSSACSGAAGWGRRPWPGHPTTAAAAGAAWPRGHARRSRRLHEASVRPALQHDRAARQVDDRREAGFSTPCRRSESAVLGAHTGGGVA